MTPKAPAPMRSRLGARKPSTQRPRLASAAERAEATVWRSAVVRALARDVAPAPMPLARPKRRLGDAAAAVVTIGAVVLIAVSTYLAVKAGNGEPIADPVAAACAVFDGWEAPEPWSKNVIANCGPDSIRTDEDGTMRLDTNNPGALFAKQFADPDPTTLQNLVGVRMLNGSPIRAGHWADTLVPDTVHAADATTEALLAGPTYKVWMGPVPAPHGTPGSPAQGWLWKPGKPVEGWYEVIVPIGDVQKID